MILAPHPSFVVSVLFSEPKIPQCVLSYSRTPGLESFSALQRAENSSIFRSRRRSPKSTSFSALQRAENSSILDATGAPQRTRPVSVLFSEPKIPQSISITVYLLVSSPFQCSSASRKFLNRWKMQRLQKRWTVSVLFSEPKIPQSISIPRMSAASRCFSALQRAENSSIAQTTRYDEHLGTGFSALQRAENSSIPSPPRTSGRASGFQCSSASRKFLNRRSKMKTYQVWTFQCSSASRKFLNWRRMSARPAEAAGFSALQRAENSSINPAQAAAARGSVVSVLFSEPKIPQLGRTFPNQIVIACFSALQRAENSSINRDGWLCFEDRWFQCSSASRKFLNRGLADAAARAAKRFSALQRAENSSMFIQPIANDVLATFQCSSASRKFLNTSLAIGCINRHVVSVLFSEPKIPQFVFGRAPADRLAGFSALQRAENSSIVTEPGDEIVPSQFQCSSASRKFLNLAETFARLPKSDVSVLFSEPKIPQSFQQTPVEGYIIRFSALQRAENSSMSTPKRVRCPTRRFSALQRAENSSILLNPAGTRAA